MARKVNITLPHPWRRGRYWRIMGWVRRDFSVHGGGQQCNVQCIILMQICCRMQYTYLQLDFGWRLVVEVYTSVVGGWAGWLSNRLKYKWNANAFARLQFIKLYGEMRDLYVWCIKRMKIILDRQCIFWMSPKGNETGWINIKVHSICEFNREFTVHRVQRSIGMAKCIRLPLQYGLMHSQTIRQKTQEMPLEWMICPEPNSNCVLTSTANGPSPRLYCIFVCTRLIEIYLNSQHKDSVIRVTCNMLLYVSLSLSLYNLHSPIDQRWQAITYIIAHKEYL